MKSLTWFKWKPILILIVYLAFVVIWGSSLAIMIIEESEAWAIVWLISSVLVLFGAFLIEGYSNGYKWKYYFLGKNFKKQRDEFFKNHEKVSKKEKRKILKDMKNTYRRFGFVDYAVDDYVVTPIKFHPLCKHHSLAEDQFGVRAVSYSHESHRKYPWLATNQFAIFSKAPQ